MNPTRVWATGYRTFADLDLDIPQGCTAIVGPNGAGKSSLVNIVDVALFAQPGEMGSNDVLASFADEVETGIEFEHAGDLYKVRRQCRRGKSATCDFEVWKDSPLHSGDDTGPCWEPMSRENVKATGVAIEELLGLNRTTFRASAFMRQHDAAAFTSADPSKRKELLADILQLGRWKTRADTATADAKQVDAELQKLAGRVEHAERTAALRGDVEQALNAHLDEEVFAITAVRIAETALEEVQAEIANANAATERLRAAEAEFQTARGAYFRVSAQLDEAQQANVKLTDEQRELATLGDLADQLLGLTLQLEDGKQLAEQAEIARRATEQALQQASRHDADAHRAGAEASAFEQQVVALHAKVDALDLDAVDDRACDACGQPLVSREARQHQVDGWNAQAAELLEQVKTKREEEAKARQLAQDQRAAAVADEPVQVPDIAQLEQKVGRAREAKACIEALEQLIATYRKKANQLPLLKAELEQLAAAVAEKQAAVDEAKQAAGDTSELEQRVATIRRDLVDAKARHANALAQVAAATTRLDQVAEAEQEIQTVADERKQLQARMDVYKLAERAFGRDGTPALLVEAVAVPQLEAEANRILEELPMADGRIYTLELRTQRANASNDTVREVLDIVVYDGDAAREYETYSGGERMRVDLALRRALSRVLAHRRGAEVPFMAVDEPDGLDRGALLALPGLLEQLVAAGELDRVLVVSHQDELATAFEQTVTLECRDRRSRIVEQAVEAVAA